MAEFRSSAEAIREAIRRLDAQGVRSEDGAGDCLYTDREGNHCGVGIVAPSWSLEPGQPFGPEARALGGASEERLNLIAPDGEVCQATWAELQTFHDTYWEPSSGPAREQVSDFAFPLLTAILDDAPEG